MIEKDSSHCEVISKMSALVAAYNLRMRTVRFAEEQLMKMLVSLFRVLNIIQHLGKAECKTNKKLQNLHNHPVRPKTSKNQKKIKKSTADRKQKLQNIQSFYWESLSQ